MSDVPPPPPAAPLPPATPVDPQKQVELPSYGLMAVGGLNFLWVLYLIGASLFGMAIGGTGGTFSFLVSGLGTVVGIIWALAVGGFTIYGAMQMKSLRNYNMALGAAIVAMIPCNYCCCVGIGIGIWALVILMKPEVKAAFINK